MTDNCSHEKPIEDYIRAIPDFPKPGILFRDITTLLKEPRGMRMVVDQIVHAWAGKQIDKVAGIEARGFILGGAIAHQLSAGFVAIRKSGKLPSATISEAYQLEYGSEVLEIHTDAVVAHEKILVVDDLLATGGTVGASMRLLERLGAIIVGCSFIVNLPDLGGQKKLAAEGIEMHSLCEFSGA